MERSKADRPSARVLDPVAKIAVSSTGKDIRYSDPHLKCNEFSSGRNRASVEKICGGMIRIGIKKATLMRRL